MIKRPAQIVSRTPLPSSRVKDACYVGSPEHKSQRWWGGLPGAHVDGDGVPRRPRKQLTTICHLVTDVERDEATKWVQRALQDGQFRYTEGDKDFPKHIWYRDCKGQNWFGFCINTIRGEYKGWPVKEEERIEIFR